MQFTDNIHEAVEPHLVGSPTLPNRKAIQVNAGTFDMTVAAEELLSNPALTLDNLVTGYVSTEMMRNNLANIAESWRQKYLGHSRDVDSDMETLSTDLWERMEAFGMTAEDFDKWVQTVNDVLGSIAIKKRKRMWNVTVQYEVTLEKVLKIEATDEDSAREAAYEEWDESDIVDQFRDEFDGGEISVENVEEYED